MSFGRSTSLKTGQVMNIIRQPVNSFNFQARFKSMLGTMRDDQAPLSDSLIHISKFELLPGYNPHYGVTDNYVTFTFRDTADNSVMTALNTILDNAVMINNQNGYFKVEVDLLDGRATAMRTYEFEKPSISSMKYGTLDYSGADGKHTNIEVQISYTKIITTCHNQTN